MSLVLCRDGCGEYAELKDQYICEECQKNRLLSEAWEMEKQLQMNEPEINEFGEKVSKKGIIGRMMNHVTRKKSRRSKIEQQAKSNAIEISSSLMDEFYLRPREVAEFDVPIIQKEIDNFRQEQQARRIAEAQLRKYMIATDKGIPVDPAIWSKYHYGAPGEPIGIQAATENGRLTPTVNVVNLVHNSTKNIKIRKSKT